ncbi:Uncharacterised protein [Vibrio cholerae]|nr:Uncharacterised protein [Vibrio cholerae]CSI51994.1 Uncharacterised protein [Vibrio cholerae]
MADIAKIGNTELSLEVINAVRPDSVSVTMALTPSKWLAA